MENHVWKARNKRELMIEVWENLDCESVGAAELLAIESVVRQKFGPGAVDPPAMVARLLADEGAELRHPEILQLDVEHRDTDPYRTMLHDLLEFSSLEDAAAALKRLDDLRREFAGNDDREGLRRIREVATKARRRSQLISKDSNEEGKRRRVMAEIAEWFRVWLHQPDLFHDWLELRRRSKEFLKQFTTDQI
ncbi:MAG: hypothetical protein QOJ64_3557 [Acidobacteriota bacterium]|jgi:hypothetical protein|nr:hypothetical protein [Acidobacteriota bacterium]